jgi:hypothetical protein
LAFQPLARQAQADELRTFLEANKSKLKLKQQSLR